MRRVFVSSTIGDFQAYRQAACQAITLVGLTPVMAEDLPAQPRSPQSACLEGLRSSDVYVGILGPRYGSPTESGRSATEEEFDEASRRSIPRLLFRTTSEADQDQAEFIERVRGRWGDGLFYAQFDTPEELKDEIVKALSAMSARPVTLTDVEASRHLADLLDRTGRINEDVVLSLSMVPDSVGHALIGLGDLDAFAQDLPALVGMITRGRKGDWEVVAKERSVEMSCPTTRDEAPAVFEAFDDGRLFCGMGQRPPHRNDLAGAFIIDADRVESDLAAIIEAFSTVLRRLDPRGSVIVSYVQGRLKGVERKKLDVVPREPLNSMTVPSHQLRDPLPFPTRPLSVSVQDLERRGVLAHTLRGTLMRLFQEGLRPSAS